MGLFFIFIKYFPLARLISDIEKLSNIICDIKYSHRNDEKLQKNMAYVEVVSNLLS